MYHSNFWQESDHVSYNQARKLQKKKVYFPHRAYKGKVLHLKMYVLFFVDFNKFEGFDK